MHFILRALTSLVVFAGLSIRIGPFEEAVENNDPVRFAIVHGCIRTDRLLALSDDVLRFGPGLTAVIANENNEILAGPITPGTLVPTLANDDNGPAAFL